MSASSCLFNGRDINLPHRQHRLKGPFRLVAASSQRVDEHTRSDLPRHTPSVLAPAALALLATVVNDGIPVAVGLLLRVGRDLEGERLTLWKLRATVEAHAGNAEHREVHGDDVTFFATRIVRRRRLHARDVGVGKGLRVETGRVLGIVVEPDTDHVFGSHGPSPCKQRARGAG